MNIAEENAFTQSIRSLSLTNISKNTHSSPWNQKTGYKWRTLFYVSKFIFLLCPSEKPPSSSWSLSAIYRAWRSVMVFREKRSLLTKVQKNCKNKQHSNRSSHQLLICKLRFRHINGRVPLKLSMAQLIWLPQPDHLFPWRLWHFLLTKRFLVVMSKREKPCSLSASSTRVAIG